MKLIKWPFTSGPEPSPPPKEVMVKFLNLTKYLFLIEEPEDIKTFIVLDQTVQGNNNNNSLLHKFNHTTRK